MMFQRRFSKSLDASLILNYIVMMPIIFTAIYYSSPLFHHVSFCCPATGIHQHTITCIICYFSRDINYLTD